MYNYFITDKMHTYLTFCAFAQVVTTFIFFLAWDKSRVKWDNSRNSTQKMRTLGATKFFFMGHLQKEFPRYLYIKEQIWAKKGITDENSLTYKLTMQREIFVQCLCNMGAFVIPLLVQALGYKTGK